MNVAAIMVCASLSASDGDSIYCGDELVRMLGDGTPHVSGVDTPELCTYKCQSEKRRAQAAHRRMKDLLKIPGVLVEDSGERDATHTKRRLVRVWVPTPSGTYETAGSILLREGHAKEWVPNRPITRCGLGFLSG